MPTQTKPPKKAPKESNRPGWPKYLHPNDCIHDGRDEQRNLAYSDYLLTPHWQIVKHAALILGHNQCARCCARFQLNVHHITYKNLWHELVRDLVVLCWSCHGIEHGLEY